MLLLSLLMARDMVERGRGRKPYMMRRTSSPS